jgi:plasmid stabilization system protein ParE
VQGHGWCRNLDYEGRDDTVLLRASELACRVGWQKDHWHTSGDSALVEMVASAASSGEPSGTLPIGQGIGSLAVADAGVQAAKAALVAARPSASAFPAGRRRPLPAAAAGAGTAVAAPRAGQEAVAVVAASLQGHPELGPSGEMIRRPSRSVVAEAHRKALERRESERELVEKRRKEQQEAALASLYASSKPAGGNDTVPTPPRPLDVPATPPMQPSVPIVSNGAANALSQMTTPRGSAIPEAPRELEDRQVAPDRPAVPAEVTVTPAREEVVAGLPPAVPLGTDLTPPSVTRLPEPVIPAPREAPIATGNARYWDEPGPGERFTRMIRPEPAEAPPPRPMSPPATVQSVPTVGRSRAEQSLPVDPPTTGRTIRPLGAAPPAEPESAPTQSAPRLQRPAVATELRPTEPALPVLPPRQIDEQLLQQLRQDWRERALAAHAGKRCGTCRYFQAAEGAGQGSCGCQLAASYRQVQGRQDLGCVNSFGTWWAANDDGWLQKADLGQRQPTPLVDQLLREWGIPDAPPAATERRREAR